jgi:hypothetical protein
MKYTHSFLQLMLFIFGISTPSFTHLSAASASDSAHPPRRSSITVQCERIKLEDPRFKETDTLDFSFVSPIQGIAPYFMVTEGEGYLVITVSPADTIGYSRERELNLGIRAKRISADYSLSIELFPLHPKNAIEEHEMTISSLKCATRRGNACYLLERKTVTNHETGTIARDVPKVTFNLALDESITTPNAFYRIPSGGTPRINFIFPLVTK